MTTLFLRADGRLRQGWRFVLALLVAYVANYLAVQVAFGMAQGQRQFDAVYRPAAMVLVAAGFSVLLRLIDGVPGNPLAAMGVALRGPWFCEALAGVGLGFAMIALGVGCIAIFGHYSMAITLTKQMLRPGLAVLWIVATAAMLEELMFRGYPFQRLIDGAGAAGAIVITSLLFGAVHLRNPGASVWGFLNTILVGVVFSIAYLRTRALWLPWGLHFGWNFALGMVFGLPVSGLNDFSVVVHSTAQGPRWLTGGAYGIEASATGAMVLVVGLIVILKLFAQRPAPVAAVWLPEHTQLGLSAEESRPGDPGEASNLNEPS